ncbi:ATP-binding protein [Lentzea jiangxiensis]|uniref:NB-ARC domain-containing protein n=1 Tax=Lentzea jiangxiensis TaxID=641025 RepID=A0A1H0X5V7_9PSEU|nr:XRE family transcriptional regulator [Lentzea jiangxiensis]SDP98219.1 NB-ARC domain-containing protein [Lentzea jiangxiensis]
MSTTAFGDFLRFFRLRALMTQEDLAERTGVSVRAISDMERGRALTPQRRTVELLVDGLGLNGEEAADFIARSRLKRRPPAQPAVMEFKGGDGDQPKSPLLAAPTTAPAAAAVPSTACALPPMLVELTGREAEQAALDGFVRDSESSSVLQVTVVHGPPGGGKTALAIDTGYRLGSRFRDGCLFVDLRGLSDQSLTPDDAVRRLLRGFGVSDRQIPANADDKLSLYHSLLRDRTVLLVLDNALNEAQVRPLIGTSPGTMVLITSRSTLTGLDIRHRLALDLLRLDRAVTLLRAVAGEERLAPEPEAAGRVAALCGGVPLALLIAGNRLASRPQWTVSHFADQLEDERRRLSVLTAGDLQVRTAFELSYQSLCPATAMMFRRLALIQGSDTSVEHAAVLTGQPEHVAEQSLDELADASLLGLGRVPGRYTRHDLLRVFAVERLELDEDPAALAEVRDRVRHWLLAVATKAALFFDHDSSPLHDGIDGPDPVRDRESADRWLGLEHEHVRAALRSAAELGEHEKVLALAQAMHWYSDLRGTGELWRDVFRLGADAARELGDPRAEAEQLNYLSWALFSLCSELHEALAAHESAAAKALESGDLVTQGWSAYYGAAILWRLGEPEGYNDNIRRCVDLFEQAGYETGLYLGLVLLGTYLQRQGQYDEAIAVHQRCVAYHRGKTATPGTEELLAMTLTKLAETLTVSGEPAQSIVLLDEAESMFRKHSALMAVSRVQRLRGIALLRLGRWQEAEQQLQHGLDASRAIEDKVESLAWLAELADERGDAALAREHRVRALAECTGFDTPMVRSMAAKIATSLGVSLPA